jgi:hypothetical protein
MKDAIAEGDEMSAAEIELWQQERELLTSISGEDKDDYCVVIRGGRFWLARLPSEAAAA